MEVNKTQISAVFLIVGAIFIGANPTVGGLIFFSVALIYFAYFVIMDE